MTSREIKATLAVLESPHIEAVIILSTMCGGCRDHARHGLDKLIEELQGRLGPHDAESQA